MPLNKGDKVVVYNVQNGTLYREGEAELHAQMPAGGCPGSEFWQVRFAHCPDILVNRWISEKDKIGAKKNASRTRH